MTEYIILIPLGILIFGLTPIVARDSYLNKQQKKIMTEIIGLIFLLVIQNVADYILQTVISMPYLRTLVSIAGYIIRPTIIVFFLYLYNLQYLYILLHYPNICKYFYSVFLN